MPATLQIRRLRVCARPHPGELRDSAAGDAAASGWGRRRRRGVWSPRFLQGQRASLQSAVYGRRGGNLPT
uniref:Uncharacterized protein n=1 Tax=Leersia perrieri TaxID=77586 RepID=A0A0D9UYR6_9ORYZ